MFNLFLILLFTSFSIQSFSNSIYVSNDGNDNNNGKITSPFRTINKAIETICNLKNIDTIYIRKGEYPLNSTLLLSNIENVVICAYNNEKVSITGGITINKNVLKKDKFLKVRKEQKKRIRYIDCSELNIKLSGLIKKGIGESTTPSWNELFINDESFIIARWPNDKMILLDSIINKGNIKSKNEKKNGFATFKYKEEEPDKWHSANDLWLCGYFGEGWGDELLPIKTINKKDKTITLNSDSQYGFKSGKNYLRWYICNIKTELDQNNEYFIDKTNNKIYFYYPPQKIKKIQISTLTKPITRIYSCRKITLKNICFECTRGIGIDIENSADITIDSCTIRNIGQTGIRLSGASLYNNRILNTTLYQIGSYGIILDGGNRKKLISGNNIVKNCRIHNFSRIEHSYRPAILINGCGNTISNVEIYNSPSMAIMLHGNNHTIKYVDIHDVCKEVHDQGAFYYGRNPAERGNQIIYSYFHDIQSQFDVRAIYHDDGACGMLVKGCIFNNISSTPIQIGGGQDNTYINNIFMNVTSAIMIDNRLKTWGNRWLQPGGEFEKNLNAINYKEPPYSTIYPELANYWINDPTIPQNNVIEKNIFFNVNKIINGNKNFLILKNNMDVTNSFHINNNPLDGLNYEIIKNNIHDFEYIPIENIGCKL